MKPSRVAFAFAFALSLTLASPLAAQETGGFVVRLGRDTTGVETYTRTANRVEVRQVGRAPRVTQRHFVYDFAPGGGMTQLTAVVTLPSAPAGAAPMQQIQASFASDSMTMEVRRDTSLQTSRMGVPAAAVVISGASPWVMYERQTMRLAAQKADSLRAPFYYLGSSTVGTIVVRKLGRDSASIQTPTELYHARVDGTGRLLNVVPIEGTAQFTVDRVTGLDVAATTAAYAAREQQGGTMGALSTRDTVRANAGGAALWIDYGRPSKRGRVVFGGVVPWGELWRTGANAATQFRTDKALELGGVAVPAGFYSLWTVPSPTGWKLIVNGETGQSGTAHKAERDLYTVPMSVSILPQSVERFTVSVTPSAQGGSLNLDWDTTRASVPFVVKP